MRVEKVEPRESWIKGDNLQDCLESLLTSLFWAKDHVENDGVVYGSFGAPVPNSRDIVVSFRIYRRDAHGSKVLELNAEAGFTEEREHSGIKATLTCPPAGQFGGTATLNTNGLAMVRYGIRMKDAQPTWCVTGRYLWHNVNDIEADQMPTNKGQLVSAIRHYYNRRGVQLLKNFQEPDDFNPRLQTLIYNGLSANKGQFEQLDWCDMQVFRSLVMVHRASRIADGEVTLAKSDEDAVVFFNACHDNVKMLYEIARGK